jgi:hypothetical protein
MLSMPASSVAWSTRSLPYFLSGMKSAKEKAAVQDSATTAPACLSKGQGAGRGRDACCARGEGRGRRGVAFLYSLLPPPPPPRTHPPTHVNPPPAPGPTKQLHAELQPSIGGVDEAAAPASRGPCGRTNERKRTLISNTASHAPLPTPEAGMVRSRHDEQRKPKRECACVCVCVYESVCVWTTFFHLPRIPTTNSGFANAPLRIVPRMPQHMWIAVLSSGSSIWRRFCAGESARCVCVCVCVLLVCMLCCAVRGDR